MIAKKEVLPKINAKICVFFSKKICKKKLFFKKFANFLDFITSKSVAQKGKKKCLKKTQAQFFSLNSSVIYQKQTCQNLQTSQFQTAKIYFKQNKKET